MTSGTGAPRKDEDEIRCRLVVFSPRLRPEDVTARSGMQATTVRHRGYRARPGAGPKDGLAEHQWIWEPDDDVTLTLDAQLDAIWSAIGPSAAAFRNLQPEARVVVDIVFEHYGSELSFGWELHERHVAMASALGASVSVDEYDYTGDD